MADIDVQTSPRDGGWSFRVTVAEGGSSSVHEVSLSENDHQRLSGGACDPDQLVRWSFEFLLEREPKESILRRFDLTVISRYFPEYEGEIARRMPS